LEQIAIIFASAIHDVDHPGVSSQYLIDSGRYSIISIHLITCTSCLHKTSQLTSPKLCCIVSKSSKKGSCQVIRYYLFVYHSSCFHFDYP